MFQPEQTDEKTLTSAAIAAAGDIFDLQNENRNPDGGTLGFTMGAAMALGELANAYVQGGTTEQRDGFLNIVMNAVGEAFDKPQTVATLEGLPKGRVN